MFDEEEDVTAMGEDGEALTLLLEWAVLVGGWGLNDGWSLFVSV